MKRILVAIIFILFLFFTPPANAQSSDWVINNFSSNINILPSGQIQVIEDIDVDFKNEQKHGIYRDLPYVYENEDKSKTYTKIEDIQVTQDSQKAKIQTTNNDSYLRIRIGDPDKTINGKHNYHISYDVTGVIKPFSDHDELFWNVTGNEWEAEILKAQAVVTAPDNSIIRSACFEGPVGSSFACNYSPGTNKAIFSNKNVIYPGYDLSVVVGIKKGTVPIITVPRPKTLIEGFFAPASEATFGFALFAGIATTIYLWFKFGRDYWTYGITGYKEKNSLGVIRPFWGAHEPVVVEYTSPENIPPAIIGVIMDERADTLDVTSTIIDLARRGFLKIDEIPKKWIFGKIDYKFTKTSKQFTDLHSYEKELMNGLFEDGNKVTVSDLKTEFYDNLAKVKEKLYQEVVSKKYFFENPEKIRTKYLLIGFGILFVSVVGLIFSLGSKLIYLLDLSLAGIIIGIIIFIFSRFMPRRTALGREIYRRAKGYRLFLEKVETHRQKFFERKNMFDEVLPYVIIFGLTGKFAKALSKMGTKVENPSWYHSANAFNAVAFSNNLNGFSKTLSTTISSSPSSSGFSGGSSGGGFGGGGGGSW